MLLPVVSSVTAGATAGAALADHPRGPVRGDSYGVPAAEGAHGADLCAQAGARQPACSATGTGPRLLCRTPSCRHL